MLPSTAKGWLILLVVGAVLLFGIAGAGTHLGSLVHEIIQGLKNFGNSAR